MNIVPAVEPRQQHRVTTPAGVVEAYFAAFGAGDIDGVLALLTEDVVWHVDGAVSVSTVGLLQGRERVRRWLESFPQNFKPLVFAIDRLFESGDEVVAIGRFRHTVLTTSRTAGSDVAIRFTVRDGQIARYQILEDSLLLARAFDPDAAWSAHQVRVNGTVYSYSDRGDGPVVVFAHGLFVDNTIFDAQVTVLESAYRCISFDMPGHGQTGYRKAGWTLDDIANDLALLIKEQSLGPVAFVGQSQGGMVGIRLAARRPQLVSRLVLIGTSARPEGPERLGDWHTLRNTILTGSERERDAAFAVVQKRVNSPAWLDDKPALATKERAIMLSHDRVGVTLALDAAVIEREDTQALLANITAPTLVICGADDRATPVALSREIASAIPGAQIDILPGVGHHPPLEAPHEVAASLRQFLA